MNNKKAIAHFRQLCGLGLTPESVAPALLEAMHSIVPSLHNRIAWCDERDKPTAIYCEAPEMYPYTKLFQVDGSRSLDVLVADERSTLATINLQRAVNSKPFSDRETETLDHLVPYMVHAFRTPTSWSGGTGGRRQTAVLLVESSGRLGHATGRARQWLGMALFPNAREGDIRGGFDASPPAFIRTLCRALADMQAGHDANAPSHSIDNAWGLFRFSAMPLHDHDDARSDQTAIMIEYREREIVTLMRNMWTLGLSTVQKDLCIAMMKNTATEAQIAQDINVSPTTVRDHLCKIYRKLDIHSREELVKRLSASIHAI